MFIRYIISKAFITIFNWKTISYLFPFHFVWKLFINLFWLFLWNCLHCNVIACVRSLEFVVIGFSITQICYLSLTDKSHSLLSHKLSVLYICNCISIDIFNKFLKIGIKTREHLLIRNMCIFHTWLSNIMLSYICHEYIQSFTNCCSAIERNKILYEHRTFNVIKHD